MKKALFYGICTAILCLCHACQDPSRLEICNLRCEMLEAPLAIDNTSPHFSWEMRSKDNAMGISAYQILVATEPGRLNEKEADLWNSGKVEKVCYHNTFTVGKGFNGAVSALYVFYNCKADPSAGMLSVAFRYGVCERNDSRINVTYSGLAGEEVFLHTFLEQRTDRDASVLFVENCFHKLVEYNRQGKRKTRITFSVNIKLNDKYFCINAALE